MKPLTLHQKMEALALARPQIVFAISVGYVDDHPFDIAACEFFGMQYSREAYALLAHLSEEFRSYYRDVPALNPSDWDSSVRWLKEHT